MIHRISSSLPTFKNLEFHSGLNLLLAEKSEGATSKKTRNRAGKTSLIEIIHFLFGGKTDEKTPFHAKELQDATFQMELDLSGESFLIERTNQKRAGFKINDKPISTINWKEQLGNNIFEFKNGKEEEGKNPTFRSLFAYVRNRKDYLTDELEAAKSRIEIRNQEKMKLDERRSVVMGMLKSYGALDQFTKLQGEIGRLESEVASLRKGFETAEQLEGKKSEFEIERNHLLLRLRRDFTEQKERLSQAILAYEEVSKHLYEDAGSMLVEETSNGPKFQFPIHGSRSKGIKNMQIFCFDMMLMRLCSKRGIGPGFLVHDSHLFDGVDGRQVISALRVGAETAQELGFQYIVTMNEDDAFKEIEKGFDLNDYLLNVKLTDATEDGGLFGIRFD